MDLHAAQAIHLLRERRHLLVQSNDRASLVGYRTTNINRVESPHIPTYFYSDEENVKNWTSIFCVCAYKVILERFQSADHAEN